MTPRTEIAFTAPRRHGWKDTIVVAFLLIVLGAFVAQLLPKPAPSASRAPDTTAASQVCQDARC